MNSKINNIGVVILAAGKGKRMGDVLPLPKVLYPIGERPMMSHLLDSIAASVVASPPVIVIAPDLFIIRETLGGHYEYAVQESQLGTGHAVLSAKEKLKPYDHVLVLYGDHPFVSVKCINTLIEKHRSGTQVVTLATVTVPDFEGWRSAFTSFARVVRNEKGQLERIVEMRDATDAERTILEVNPGYYIFRASWLWTALPTLDRNNAQGEYYLTDLLRLAHKEGKSIETIQLEDPREALGINTMEQLQSAESLLIEMHQVPQKPLL